MIVGIVCHVTSFEKDGWMCHEPTGVVTVTRDDGSRERMSKDDAMEALEKEGYRC